MAQLPSKQGVDRGLGAARVCGRTKPRDRISIGGKQNGALPELATELLALKVDVLWVPTCGAPLTAAMRATTTIPIVVAACSDDMVAAGIVQSLARPAGNVTSIQKLTPELAAKRLELLKEVVPKASRVAILWDPAYSDFAADWAHLRAAARSLGVTLLSVEANGPA